MNHDFGHQVFLVHDELALDKHDNAYSSMLVAVMKKPDFTKYLEMRLDKTVEWLMLGCFVLGYVTSSAFFFWGQAWILLAGFSALIMFGLAYQRNKKFYKATEPVEERN